MATATYYFDAHTAISDPGSVWTSDSNAFDGNTATYPTYSTTSTISSNYLEGTGTTAPSTGLGGISKVRVRVYDARAIAPSAGLITTIYDGSTVLGTASGGINDYGGWVVLSIPSGGWTWSILRELKARIYSGDSGRRPSRVELEVTYGGIETYYFDAHNSVSDSQSVWSNDANAYDGNTGTSATTSTASNGTNNKLILAGTTAPVSRSDIVAEVRGRAYVNGSWSSYTTLDPPSGGWTWDKVRNLYVELYYRDTPINSGQVIIVSPLAGDTLATISGFSLPMSVSKVELEVSYASSNPALSTLVDRFEGSSINSTLWEASGTYTVSSGMATLNSATIESASPYNLTDSGFVVEVGSLGTGFTIQLTDTSPDKNFVYLYYTSGSGMITLWAGSDFGSSDITSFSYNSSTMKFFRFWHGGSNGVVTEYSANGTDWTRIAGNSGYLESLTSVKLKFIGYGNAQVKGVNYLEQTTLIKRVISQDCFKYGWVDTQYPLSLKWPSQPTEGNLLVVTLSGLESANGMLPPPPAGWKFANQRYSNASGASTSGSVAIYYKIAGASEPTIVDFFVSFLTAGLYAYVTGYEYSGVDQVIPLDYATSGATPTTTATTTVDTGSTSGTDTSSNGATGYGNLMVAVAAGFAPSSITTSVSNSFSKARDVQNSTYSHLVAEKILGDDRTAQSTTVTWSTTKLGVAVLASFRPATVGVQRYYFDGHTSVVDANNVWNNESNAVDDNDQTAASTTSSGSSSSNNLTIIGTNAPSTGDNSKIVQVRVRMLASGNRYYWSPWDILEVPSGGWTWAKINGLKAICYNSSGTTRTCVIQDVASGINIGFPSVYDNASTSFGLWGIELEVLTADNQYYFDGHTSIVDADAAWSSDSNAFDNSTVTSAYSETAGSLGPSHGDPGSNKLQGTGTTAPSSGSSTIKQVRVRMYATSDFGGAVRFKVFDGTTGVGEGSVTRSGGSINAPWFALNTPSGGWTWAKVNSLMVHIANATGAGEGHWVNRVDVAVVIEPYNTSTGNMIMMFL